jgi:hypothetical protein
MLPLYGQELQKAHAEDLINEAARHRIAAARRHERGAGLRFRLGSALISAGNRIGGSEAYH